MRVEPRQLFLSHDVGYANQCGPLHLIVVEITPAWGKSSAECIAGNGTSLADMRWRLQRVVTAVSRLGRRAPPVGFAFLRKLTPKQYQKILDKIEVKQQKRKKNKKRKKKV